MRVRADRVADLPGEPHYTWPHRDQLLLYRRRPRGQLGLAELWFRVTHPTTAEPGATGV